MDKNAIKKYAVWARTELITRVSQRAEKYDITAEADANASSVNGVLLSDTEKKQRKALIEQVKQKGFDQVMEEVAYTWFNRFIALRFMEVNGYLPSHIRVFTDENNNFKPQILSEAIHLELDGLDMEKVYEMKNNNENDELYKYLIIIQCNDLSKILPGMFQKISDYTELLFPDNILRDGSVIEQMIALILEDDWKDQVQIIGWMYQYYNTDPKAAIDQKVKKGIKVTKTELPAKTQIFTPDWVVRYLVENSLGRLWIEGHPESKVKENWRYYLEESEQKQDVQSRLNTIYGEYGKIVPEDIKCLDPCCGSGHMCVYMFDVLVMLYEDYGFSAKDSVKKIVSDNIFAVDIDERAVQLAYFSIMMKAVEYDNRFLRRPNIPQPNVYQIVETNSISTQAVDYFAKNESLKNELKKIMHLFSEAKEYGSLLDVSSINFEELKQRIDEIENDISIWKEEILHFVKPLIDVGIALGQKYDVVVTN